MDNNRASIRRILCEGKKAVLCKRDSHIEGAAMFA